MQHKLSDIAKFMHEHLSRKPDAIIAEAAERWPGATHEDLLQAMTVASDIMFMDAAVDQAEVDEILAWAQADGRLQ